MDPCPFVRLTVGNLALKITVASKPARSVVHPSSSPFYCKIKLKGCPLQTAVVPYIAPETAFPESVQGQTLAAATFHLNKTDIKKVIGKSLFVSGAKSVLLKISIYTGRQGTTCGFNSGRLLGKVTVPLDLDVAESKGMCFHNGWVDVGRENSSAQFHLIVKSEPDPRFVFQFDGEPECSPQVFQIKGNIRQPVFSCKFSFRSTPDRNQPSRSLASEQSGGLSRGCLSSFGREREKPGKERKGWSITIHDLSGSPVAAASMVTPFVASPGSDRVSSSNPGSWLILRPGDGTWNPWGRLEAWRERGSSDGLGYRFKLIPDSAVATGVLLAESTLSCNKGGKFVIDLSSNNGGYVAANGKPSAGTTTPVCSPRTSGDFGYAFWPHMYRGFVMSATIAGLGGGSSKSNNNSCSKGKSTVEVSVQHVNCTEDAAVFVALAAAIDLSMDACKLFSQKLRKELCPP